MSARLGVLSFIFEKRHVIAYQVGLITEIPIALCGGDYDVNRELKIQHVDHDEDLPLNFTQAREIVLFLNDVDLIVPKQPVVFKESALTLFIEPGYLPPGTSIFHPPCEA